jgi:outer membrane biosynthesis protein TonB
MALLVKKDLVIRKGHPPLFSLSDEGLELAERMMKAEDPSFVPFFNIQGTSRPAPSPVWQNGTCRPTLLFWSLCHMHTPGPPPTVERVAPPAKEPKPKKPAAPKNRDVEPQPKKPAAPKKRDLATELFSDDESPAPKEKGARSRADEDAARGTTYVLPRASNASTYTPTTDPRRRYLGQGTTRPARASVVHSLYHAVHAIPFHAAPYRDVVSRRGRADHASRRAAAAHRDP